MTGVALHILCMGFGLLVCGPLCLKASCPLPASACPVFHRNFLRDGCLTQVGGGWLPPTCLPAPSSSLKIWKGETWNVLRGIEGVWPAGKQTRLAQGSEELCSWPLRGSARCQATQSSERDPCEEPLNLQKAFIFQLLSCPRSSLCCPSSYLKGKEAGAGWGWDPWSCPPAGGWGSWMCLFRRT